MKKDHIYTGDCLEVMKRFPNNSIDSVVSDPPYGLKFMGKKWDHDVPGVEVWNQCLRVLKPGGHLLSFAGTRTQHRMAVNIEDAGFEIRDMIAWVYGSGFPKSHNIGKAVDKLQGNEREFVSENPANRPYNLTKGETSTGWKSPPRPDKTKGNSPWEGWGTALKPAWESLTVAQKGTETRTDTEYSRDICQTLLATTAKQISTLNLSEPKGGLSIAQWIAEKNISTLDDLSEAMAILQSYKTENTNLNIVLSWLNILAENWLAMNTSTISTKLNTITELKILNSLEWESILENITQAKSNQTDGWSADVYNAISLLSALKLKLKHTLEHSADDNAIFLAELEDLRPKLDPIVVARKPISEKNIAENVLKHGTGGINIDESRVATDEVRKGGATTMGGLGWKPSKEVYTNGRFPANFIHDGSDEVVGLFPNTGSGKFSKGSKRTTKKSIYELGFKKKDVQIAEAPDNYGDKGSAARFFYTAKSSKSERNKNNSKNFHPTVKPIDLMQYLVRLVTPPKGVCLDPFIGSGTTAIACMRENIKFIGIEIEPEYVKIAKKRISRVQPKLL